MMEQIKIVQLPIAVLCCVVVAGVNVPIGTGAETQNLVISGQERPGVRATSTNRSPFVCADGSGSINRTLLCNGRIDCADSSDENAEPCLGISCMNTFPCLNGKCISLDSRCNGLDDCGDNTDENLSICHRPPYSQIIICTNGQILVGTNITCNGIYNCMDKSDEFNCSRCPGQLMCDKGYRCVKPEAFCDRIQDCFDGADESCLIPENQRCNVGNFICPSGKCVTKDKIMSGNRCWDSHVLTGEDNLKYCKLPNVLCDNATKCIPPEYRCDGKLDCQDGSDEMSQNKNIISDPSFKCANGYCLPYVAMCDGTNDCGDSSDELPINDQCLSFSAVNCPSVGSMNSYYWQCNNSLCIPSYRVNDGRNDCGDFSDEKNSSVFYFTCTNGKKVLRTFLCDGRDNCGDNSDEIDLSCTVNTQRPTCHQYTCPSGKCIHFTDVCDGYNDCGDLSEEKSCTFTTRTQPTTLTQTTTRTQTGTHICWGHTCASGKCITYSEVCNNINDCGDNSDEIGCPCLGHSCPSGKCILTSEVCDGNYDCEDFSDESDCITTHTAKTYTYSYTKVATGVTVPGGLVIFVGGCYCFRRRRVRAIYRTTRTPIATAAVITTTAVASDLPPSYSLVPEAYAPGQGIVNPAFTSSA